MKAIISIHFKLLLIAFLFPFNTQAQKLPNVQEGSLRSPTIIKVDGKAIEWNNKFQAYNKNTGIFYTISNDSDNLYLTLQATDQNIIRKIALGGITFTINAMDTKDNKSGMAISFPAYYRTDPLFFITTNNRPESDITKDKIQMVTLMNERNEQLKNKFKTIGVIGIKTIKDSLLSIYNEQGIKAAALFDNNIDYIYELAVPIKHLDLSINNLIKFNYNIKLNGLAANGNRKFIRDDVIMMYGADGIGIDIGATFEDILALTSPTDFWGEYTLAN